jgi:hypothetical protein
MGDTMPTKHPTMGGAAWTKQVFSSPPARALKGHSRRTQHHRYYSSQLNMMVGVQGRNEACTALAIEYLVRLGLLKRAKAQPFKTDSDQFGSEIYPDFLVEGAGLASGLYVIETKSARFLTRLKNLELEDYRNRFAQFGMKYLVWTDQRPLNHSVRHNLQKMRAGSNRDVTSDEIDQLVNWVRSQPQATLSNFYKDGFDLDCLDAAAWKAKVFYPITRPLLPETILSCQPQEDYNAIFLNCFNSTEDWWNQLSAC